jgi:signal transduction histidine kinase
MPVSLWAYAQHPYRGQAHRRGELAVYDKRGVPLRPLARIAPARLSLNRPRFYALGVLLAAGTAAAAATIWTTVPSSVLANAESIGILRGLLVGSWVAAGAYMWWERPESRLGLLLAGAGLLYALTSLMASDEQSTYTAGRIALAVFLVYLSYVYLCFPGDHVVADRDRRFIAGFALATIVVWPFVLAFSDRLPEGGALNACANRCPANALRVAGVRDGISDSLNATVAVVTTVGLLGTAVLLLLNARSPAHLRRRAVEPVAFAYVILAVSYLANSIGDLSGGALDAAQVGAAIGGFLTPVAMLAGQARARSYASVAAGQLVARGRAERMTPARLEKWLRDALGDPTLEVAFWDRLRLRFVDIDGNSIDWAGASPGRAVTPVVHDGRPVAAIAHSASLQEAPDVVDGLAETALMILENARLVDELRASRARIVATADEERHRLERDLHDGAQQRLFLLQIKLQRLRKGLADEALVGKIEEIEADAGAALEELRVLAHGIFPTVLVESGVPEALRAFAVDAPIPVEVTDHWIGRCSPTIEAALYFCALEAIQNAAKHAGVGARVRVNFDRDGDRIDLSIADDGIGFQPAGLSEGMGFVTMRDRIGGVGGQLEIISEPGAGVTVHVSITEAPLRPSSEVRESPQWRSV